MGDFCDDISKGGYYLGDRTSARNTYMYCIFLFLLSTYINIDDVIIRDIAFYWQD